MIEKKKFVKYEVDGEEPGPPKFKVISLKLNEAEQKQLEIDKKILNQVKDGTCIKQLMRLGSKVIHDDKIGEYLKIVLENKRKNTRLGIVDFE